MRIRPSILFLIAIVTILVIVALCRRKIKLNEKQFVDAPVSTATTVITDRLPSIAQSNVSASSGTTNLLNMVREIKNERTREVLSAYNDVPIDFYGKLEDQFESPVIGAEIKGSIRVISGDRQTTDWFTATSDIDGLFQFHGRGQDIGMMPSKQGYGLASLNGGGNYSMLTTEGERAHSDPNNPVVIKMWKLQGVVPLVSIDQNYSIPFTDKPFHFDLLTGKRVLTGGDIRLTVTRADGVMSGRNPLSWGIQIQAVDGGIMDSRGQDSITYEAPNNGYVGDMTFTFSTNSTDGWTEEFNRGFFVMSRNGQVYSKLGLTFRINRTTGDLMYISFSGTASTNGSRNWEGSVIIR